MIFEQAPMFPDGEIAGRVMVAGVLMEQAAFTEAEEGREMACPSCNGLRNKPRADLGVQIWECRGCGSIHGTCYLGDSYAIVKDEWAPNDPVVEARAIPYDLITLGNEGMRRRHGWFDPVTRCITQTG